MRNRTALAFAAALALAASVEPAGRALAHHGWGSYDAEKTLTLTGKIRSPALDNPHATLQLETPDKTWLVILSPPSRMVARGLPLERIAEGTEALIVGYPSKSDPKEVRAERITIAGQTTELR